LVQRGKEAALRLDFPLLLFLQAIHNFPFQPNNFVWNDPR
jgi:hypothetical protein